ncbi:MAG: hypothetical protein PWQ29_651 [Verrucomicrobiota bacterium]|nr:hypothetical protein [Verrucomicrobiota bacterium]MDK2963257.1 hypothetical protein [Verrucomicrobiota bacterium]
MAKRKFKIKGTKDFLVIAVFCGFVCIWSIRDAWFPTEQTLKKHPREIPVAFKISGVVDHIPVKPGQKISGKTVLSTLHDETYRMRVEKAEAALEAAKADQDPSAMGKALADLMAARADLNACTIENTDITWTGSHGEEVLRGVVSRVLARPATYVEAGAPVLTIKPHDTFYLFNKTLAVIMFIGMVAGLIFHWIASK